MIRWIPLLLAALAFAPGACAREAASDAPALEARVATRGLDPALTERTLATAAAMPRLNSLIVARHGEVLVERVFDGPGLNTAVNVKSASKSVLAALAGVAVQKGVLRLDEPVAPILAGRLPADADPRLQRITVEHLLAMRAGLEPTSGANYGAWVGSPNWVRDALARPFVDDPGGRMLYSTGSSHLLSAVLTARTGRSTLELARDWLGEPLGVDLPPWPRDPQGIYFGGNDMLMSPRALLAFGELYRNGGVHGGQRILPESWVRDSWTPQGVSRWSGNGYGLGWWVAEAAGRPVYFAWGFGGQMIYVVPDLALTVVMTSDADVRSTGDGHLQALHRLVSEGFAPAAERGAPATPGRLTQG